MRMTTYGMSNKLLPCQELLVKIGPTVVVLMVTMTVPLLHHHHICRISIFGRTHQFVFVAAELIIVKFVIVVVSMALRVPPVSQWMGGKCRR